MGSLKDLMYKIFEASKNDKKNLDKKMHKLSEEVGEVAEAILSCDGADGCSYKGKTKEHVVEELVDVIMIAGSMIYLVEGGKVDEDKVDKILDKKISKWLEKIGKGRKVE